MPHRKTNQWLIGILGVFFSFGSVLLTSCEKGDDDDASPSGNDNDESTQKAYYYELIIEGAINDTLTGDSAVFVDTVVPQDTTNAAMALYLPHEATSYRFVGTVVKSDTSIVDEGAYEQWGKNGPEILTTGSGANFSTGPDTSYFVSSGAISNGYIEITSRSETRAEGTIEDLKLFNPYDSVIVSGSFHAEAGQPLW